MLQTSAAQHAQQADAKAKAEEQTFFNNVGRIHQALQALDPQAANAISSVFQSVKDQLQRGADERILLAKEMFKLKVSQPPLRLDSVQVYSFVLFKTLWPLNGYSPLTHHNRGKLPLKYSLPLICNCLLENINAWRELCHLLASHWEGWDHLELPIFQKAM